MLPAPRQDSKLALTGHNAGHRTLVRRRFGDGLDGLGLLGFTIAVLAITGHGIILF